MPNTRTLYMEKTKPGKFKSVIIRYTPLEMASFDNHQTYLDRLCRLCSGKNQTRKEEVSGKVPIPTASYASKILSTFGVNVLADQVGVHPSHICRSCYDKLRRPMKRIAVEWEAHFSSSENSCKVCQMYQQMARGGRPEKPRVGLAADVLTPEHHFDTLTDKNSQSLMLEGFTLACPVYSCPICTYFLSNPVETERHHIFCLKCIRNIFRRQKEVPCPVCHCNVYFKDVHTPSSNFQETLKFSCIKCNKCDEKLLVVEKDKHQCQLGTLQSSLFLQAPNDPLTPRAEKIGTIILKRKLTCSDGAIATFKTNGKVCMNHFYGTLKKMFN